MLCEILKKIALFMKDVFNSRRLIWQLAKRDFIANYLGSYLGLIWAFIQPIMIILVLWFVFMVGFKVGPTATGIPFILWLISGMIPWFFFSDAITQGTGTVVNYSYLVKKVVFRVSVLPIVKILSSVFVHAFLLLLMLVMFVLYGYHPTWYWLQIPYFVFASFLLVLGLSWLLSALNVFVRDTGQVLAVILQFGFWGTPIFWDFNQLATSKSVVFVIMKLNPVFYIVEGYRWAMIEQVWFWQNHMKLTIYFWLITLVILAIGAFTFKKLRPHFADVL